MSNIFSKHQSELKELKETNEKLLKDQERLRHELGQAKEVNMTTVASHRTTTSELDALKATLASLQYTLVPDKMEVR